MAQFTVHRNRNEATARAYPYLIDVQSDSVDRLPTRVVVPVARATSLPYARITRLMPSVDILNEPCVLVTQELAGISQRDLGEPVADAARHRPDIIAALDLLLAGI